MLIEFWPDRAANARGDPPEVINSFAFPNLRSTGMRVVRNAEGWPKRKSDGRYIDPDTLDYLVQPEWERESFIIDIPGRVKDAAKAYYERFSKAKLSAKPYPKDHIDHRIVKTVTDPRNLLRSDVTTMVGKGYEIAEVQP